MPLNPRHRQELIAIAALLVGVFVGLSLLPLDFTGPVGRVTGRLLWQYLGVGAALIPLLGVGVGLAGFGRFGHLSLGRVALLFLGLVPLVPFAIAVLIGIRSYADVDPEYLRWTGWQKLVGMAPAALVVGVTSIVGTGGAVIAWLLAASGLTVVTLDWHPFRRLAAGAGGAAEAAGAAGAADAAVRTVPFGPPTVLEPEEDEEEAPPPPRPSRASPSRPSVRPPGGEKGGAEEADELPPIELLAAAPAATDAGEEELDRLGQVLIDTLATFRVEGKIVGRTTGPVVTQFEVAPAPGVKVGRIAALADDLALSMRAQSIRIVAPIPGKAAVGVEVPNPTARIVSLRELIEAPEWDRTRATLPIALGRDLEGKPIIADLAKMPHLLIAGATGSGKSVCINTIITSLIYRYTPRDLRMLMIDPKMVELSAYNALPHLRHAVVTNNREAAQVFKWAIHEMERRYELFHDAGARNINDYNRKVTEAPANGRATYNVQRATETNKPAAPEGGEGPLHDARFTLHDKREPLPYVVIIVDELADLMMTVQAEVEKPLAILAQKARATGVHLILATQRPSVNVITGLIKANFPSRVAFRVAAKVDSRTVLDQNGAEALLGNGDMLFLPPGRSEPIRVQGAFIGTEETEAISEWYKARQASRETALQAQGLLKVEEEDILAVVRDMEAAEAAVQEGESAAEPGERDPLFREAAETCIQHQLGSTSLLQRKLRIGYGRAARIIDQLHEAGILGPPDGSRPREVLIGMGQLDEYCN
jgi:S-DNA-T family DNA segregation ATPase FtsK/SpoIIIE